MMDYYSSFPAPSLEDCKSQLKKELIKYENVKYLLNNKIVDLDKILETSFELSNMIENKEIKGSYTHWAVFGFRNVFNKSLYICEQIIEKRKLRNKRLIRGLFKSTYILIKTHKESKEKMYNPDSDFMKEIYSKYK